MPDTLKDWIKLALTNRSNVRRPPMRVPGIEVDVHPDDTPPPLASDAVLRSVYLGNRSNAPTGVTAGVPTWGEDDPNMAAITSLKHGGDFPTAWNDSKAARQLALFRAMYPNAPKPDIYWPRMEESSAVSLDGYGAPLQGVTYRNSRPGSDVVVEVDPNFSPRDIGRILPHETVHVGQMRNMPGGLRGTLGQEAPAHAVGGDRGGAVPHDASDQRRWLANTLRRLLWK